MSRGKIEPAPKTAASRHASHELVSGKGPSSPTSVTTSRDSSGLRDRPSLEVLVEASSVQPTFIPRAPTTPTPISPTRAISLRKVASHEDTSAQSPGKHHHRTHSVTFHEQHSPHDIKHDESAHPSILGNSSSQTFRLSGGSDSLIFIAEDHEHWCCCCCTLCECCCYCHGCIPAPETQAAALDFRKAWNNLFGDRSRADARGSGRGTPTSAGTNETHVPRNVNDGAGESQVPFPLTRRSCLCYE